jgi:hypothetical protein
MTGSALIIVAVAALAGPPELRYTNPAAVRPGHTTEVAFHGTDLRGATAMWTSFPAEVELVPGPLASDSDHAAATFRITVPPEAEIGVGGVRIATLEGVSHLRLLMLDDLPSALDNAENHSLDEAQEVAAPTRGSCTPSRQTANTSSLATVIASARE